MSASTNTNQDTIYHEEYAPPFWPALIIVFPILPIFWKYRVDITDTTLQIGYSYAYSKIDRNDILSATPIEYLNGLKQFGGWGIRYNFSGDTGYIAKNGSAVKIEVKNTKNSNKNKVYVFNCENTERVCSILSGRDD